MTAVEAVWIPGWYNLDQSLFVGDRQTFAFFREIPDYLRGNGELVFYNDLWYAENAFFADALVAAVSHAVLGAIQKIETRFGEYALTLADGTRLWVESEQAPGVVYDRFDDRGRLVESDWIIEDWKMQVTLHDMSERRPSENIKPS